MPDENTLDVVIPVYNAEKHVARCLNSIARQSFRDFNVILVDDGSSDSSLALCKDFAAQQANFHVVEAPHKGQAAARNTGIEKACGEYIVFCDADDEFAPGAFDVLLSIAKRTNADFVCGNEKRIFFDGTAYSIPWSAQEICIERNCYEALLTRYLNEPKKMKPFQNIWNRLLKTRLIKDNNIFFPEDMYTAEEGEFISRYLLVSESFYYTPEVTYVYHHNQENIASSRYGRTLLEGIERHLRPLHRHLADKGIPFSEQLYGNALAEYAIVFCFHAVRRFGYSEKTLRAISEIVNYPCLEYAFDYYRRKDADNFAVIPFFLKHKRVRTAAALFWLQIKLKKIFSALRRLSLKGDNT